MNSNLKTVMYMQPKVIGIMAACVLLTLHAIGFAIGGLMGAATVFGGFCFLAFVVVILAAIKDEADMGGWN
jgi:hypothetical protein